MQFRKPSHILFVLQIILVFCLLAMLSACSTPVSAYGSSNSKRIIAVGDLHGDYSAFEKVMTRAGIMNEDGDWAAGETILVQTGDIADRGPDTRQIIEHLRALQAQAEAHGGTVIALIGNHEAMMITGNLRYLHPGEIEAFRSDQSERVREEWFSNNAEDILLEYQSSNPNITPAEVKKLWEEKTPLGLIEQRRAWAPDGEIGSWVLGNDVIAIVGENLFVHGGLSARYSMFSVDELNAMAEKALRSQSRDRQLITNNRYGPAWYRGLIRESGQLLDSGPDGSDITVEDELNLVLDRFEVERIIIGHTRSEKGIKPNHAARVIQIDTGMSAYYGGTISFLEIREDGIFANDNGVITKIDD